MVLVLVVENNLGKYLYFYLVLILVVKSVISVNYYLQGHIYHTDVKVVSIIHFQKKSNNYLKSYTLLALRKLQIGFRQVFCGKIRLGLK